MDVFQAMFDRRSVRKFLDKTVEEEKLLKIIDAARWAPSAGNIQDWQFIIVREKGKKLQLSEAALGQYWISTAQAIIVICSKIDKLTRIYGEIGENTYSMMDCALAAENIMLAAHSLGLGSCFIPTIDYGAIKRILNIPKEIKVYAIIPIGYPAEKPNAPHRMDLETMIFFEEYGKVWIYGKTGSIRPIALRREEAMFFGQK
jgi:nitroreductase